MEPKFLTWVPSDTAVTLPLWPANTNIETSAPNRWGLFELPNGKSIFVSFAYIGLNPVAVAIKNKVVIGVGEFIYGLDENYLVAYFKYQMPTVFHEFVSFNECIIARDEVGFVAIDYAGSEKWSFVVDGPIAEYRVQNKRISLTTIDDVSYIFEIP